ncbi:flagellar filament capping protein FliD [Alteromonas sp. 5E99-2]|uniref:flagellar filament capping protein FliD n=1 Tax=Alteromonas sp. 5E99-2 TaxID=2817683 RepID=UPI001A9889C6|nr:flagellar filament capping protein FliD [Alteromonas sp. 5E99-2]MBO1255253.1 flagellar filament capping protein FliD [Alteromonas sp. 5E99-2]
MSISSLGVGSGLDLESLVTQLVSAQREPRENSINAREETNEAEISALGQLTSRLSDFQDAVEDLENSTDLNGRETTVSTPDSEDAIFTAEAANSALSGTYDIQVEQLATGSRLITDDGAFTDSSDAVLSSGDGSLTFKVDGSGDSFSIDLTAGTTLAQLREQINNAEGNFGVTANIIDTGTAAGARLVITSDVTGDGNDLVIVNDDDLSDLERIATTDSSETTAFLTATENAQNAIAFVDGLEVQSGSNEFANTIQSVTFEVESVSEFEADGVTRVTSSLTVGFDQEGLETRVRDFVDNYNSLIGEIQTLSRFGESELEDDGALAGDSLLRGLQTSLANIVSENVASSGLGNLFQLGIELNSDGELEIGNTDFGLGTGEDRLQDALDDNFDDIAALFTDEDEGIATRLLQVLESYTQAGGLIDSREDSALQERDNLFDEREALELRLLNTEQILRDRYLNLDQTVSSLNSTGAALLSALG